MNSTELSFTLRVSECDANNLWRPGAILTEMQEAAGTHSSSVGCGREVIVQSGIAWVVTRLELRMLRYPSSGEKITIRTWHRPTRHRLFPRYFEIRDGRGEVVAQASSLWLLMDLETRQSVSADRLPVQLPDNSDAPEIMPLPGAIAALDAPEKVILRETVYTDLDANGHVNNTKYADWLCNALGIEEMAAHPPETLNIHFNSEILPGQPVELRLRRDGLRYQMTGSRGEGNSFEIGGTLMDHPIR